MAAPSSPPAEQPPLHGATASGLYVRVEDERRERSSDGWEYSSYTILTTYQGQSFSVQRRFREFRQLHSQLLPHLPTLSRSFPLWGNILNRYSPEVIEARKAGFARYLTDVIGALQGAEIPPPLRAFLQLPQAEEAEAQHAVAAAIPAQLEPTDHAILVAYQLPLNVERAEGGGFTVEWDDNAVLNKFALNLPVNVKWVGCISLEVSKEEEEALSDMLLEQYNCVVVFLGAQLQQDFYHGFCRTYLRPIFHCQLCLPDENDPFSDLQWRAYCTVNKKFAEKVMEVYEPGHMTWVHDYHLLLLPSYILRRHRTAHVGLFLHSPFPASDIFRTIAVREELLRAMLNADLIGFLLFEYTRNFLTCCKRMLGLEYEFRRGGFLGVEYGGRHVMVQVSTFGVSPPLLQKHIKETPTPESQRELLALRADLSSRRSPPTVIAGVDYLDRFKGVQLKLLAWESTLRNYPKFREGYVLVQICLASRNQVKLVLDADKVASEIKAIVKRINTAYPGTVYYEQREKIMTETRMAMWQLADVVVYSATREAVNVWPLEFIVARHLSNLPAGVVVLSEFSGFSRVLNGALRVNPFSQSQLQAALDQALEMPAVEREARARKDLNHISTHTSEDWGTRFLVDLKSMKRKQEEHWMAVGFGLASFRMVGMGADFKALDTQQVLLAYRQSSHRAILVDWGGTITPTVNDLYDQRDQDSYQVPESTLSVLRALCADSSNHVMIVSGLSRDKVQKAFGSVPNLSLAAEHGFHYRIKNGPWRLLLPGLNTSWREVAEAIVSVYTQRTNGSFMQKKGSSIVWNHQQADPEFGTMQARELRYHLQGVLTAFPVVVLVGKGYVEVCPKGVNKGAMAERMIEETMAQDVYDMHGQKQPLQFILCCGDDSSDEQMFSALHSKFGQRPTDLDLFTVTVGRKPSEASSYLTDHNEVVELLKMVGSLHTGRSKRAGAMSVNDLPQFEPHPRDSAISFKGPRRGADSVDGPGFRSLANSAR